MLRQAIVQFLAAAPLFGLAFAMTARAEEAPRVSGPHIHENLSIYFVHGKSADGPVPLTLAEALAKGTVEIHETGTVQQLVIENKGKDDIFVHAGDIVKGGKQDRVISASFVVPNSGRIEVPAYCVEAGRWAPRGSEDSLRFSVSAEMLPTKEAKLAMMAKPETSGLGAVGGVRGSLSQRADAPIQQRAIEPNVDVNDRVEQRTANSTDSLTQQGPAGGQGEVWRNVAEIQSKLSSKLNAKVNAAASESSLQLALENDKLAEEQNRYIKALESAGSGEADIVGYAIAVNGKIASADVYESNALFRKLWPRLLKAAVTEAISAPHDADAKAPSTADVDTFLARAADTSEDTATPVPGISVTARAAEASYDAETTRDGKLLHRSKLAR